MDDDVAIILTATITPRAIYTDFLDADARRFQYLTSLKYYSRFSQVYFIENSGYNLMEDDAFSSIPNVTYIQHRPSSEFFRGKGYQEFEMLDHLFSRHGDEFSGFLKITGRYLVENIASLLADCKNAAPYGAIFERSRFHSKVALTDTFFVAGDYYLKNISRAYLSADDSKIIYIEHVVRKIINEKGGSRVFKMYPIIAGIRGTTGEVIPNKMANRIARGVRNAFYFIDHESRLI